ncbi:phage tail tape measure protein [Sphingomonas histidinilytica]|uniref:phage tail tape measure protein n=1 Tax=Rhizorhabdus histidinilytica TaxID=439228 RepID=UPI001ADA6F5B|nr:phage tail tape measure protein [Rhizorhabdus histidinilytica]MBO9377671.1 phage tail tape measure protein [Rhizorhabdus histidinilytica]
MASSIIGQLRVILGIDTAQFDKGLDESQRSMIKAGRNFERLGQRVENIGKSMSVALTLPLTAIGGGALKMASDFESAMNRVEAATGASGAELKALRDQAKAFGADKGVTATAAQTADVMEALAKNGLTTTQILDGATEATLRLAAANNAEFAPAADLSTDIMQQFGKKATDLNTVVDKLTGGMLVSKFGFDDYRLAMGQAGGVAGGLGLTFEDTNVALAATAALFASGSDAGTSFKTFLSKLNPASKEAATLMKQLGLNFFQANGQMKPLAEIAQVLKDRLGGLADEAKTKALTTIFGTDAMRTAVGLMNQGADGLARINAEINKASAQQQMDARMKGLSGMLVQLRKMAEEAAIAFGDSGLLAAGTRVIAMLGDLLQVFAALPEPVQTGIIALIGLAAAAGPVIAVGGRLIMVWGSLMQMGPRLMAVLAGTAAGEVAIGAAGPGAAAGITALKGALSAMFATPWGIAIMAIATAIGILALNADKAGPETEEAARGLRSLREESEKAPKAIEQVGEEMKSTGDRIERAVARLKEATAALYGVEAGAAAAKRGLAQIQLAQAQANLKTVQSDDDRTMFAKMMGVQQGKSAYHKARVRAAQAAVDQAQEYVDLSSKAEAAAIARAKARQAALAGGGGNPPAVTLDNPTLDTGGSGRKKKDRTEALLARREEMELQVKMQAAQERGDLAEAQALEDKLNLTRQIADYEQTGLSKADARVAAERDMKLLQEARAKANAKAIADEQTALALDVAQIQQNAKLEDTLRRQQELEGRIQFYKEKGLSIDQATTQAKADQLKVDEARAAIQKRMLEDAEQNRQLELARARGDNPNDIRAREQAIWIRDRARDIERDGNLAPGEGIGKATAEAIEGERARMQGVFRDTFKDGFRAALTGDLKGFVKNFWQNAIMDAAQNALNSLADGLFKFLTRGSGGGGGLFGALGSVFKGAASLFGGGTFTGPTIDTDAIQASIGKTELHGFKSGGSFKVGGMSGIDKNVVSFRASKGELVDIRKPGNDRGPGGDSYHFEGNLLTPEWWAMINRGDMVAAQRGAAGGSAMAQTELRRRGRQRLGRS